MIAKFPHRPDTSELAPLDLFVEGPSMTELKLHAATGSQTRVTNEQYAMKVD